MDEIVVDTPKGKEVFYNMFDAEQVENGVILYHYGDREELIEDARLLEKYPL